MVRRTAHDYLGGVYELPGGGVDPGETIADGATRELEEETGLNVAIILDVIEGFDYSTDKKPHVRQINFIVEAEPGEIALDPDEHDAYAWVTPDTIENYLMTDKMRECVSLVLQR
jgi:8-oxo-dGTP diphosphatase